MANVLLLRAPSPVAGDRYENVFNAAGYHALSVPVLETVFVNLSVLKSIVKEGPGAGAFDGVVITSGRACEAWKSIVGDLVGPSLETEVPSGGQCTAPHLAGPRHLTHVA